MVWAFFHFGEGKYFFAGLLALAYSSRLWKVQALPGREFPIPRRAPSGFAAGRRWRKAI